MGETSNIIALILFFFVLAAFIGGIIIFIRQYRRKKNAHIAQILNIGEMHRQELLETQIEIQNQTMKHIGREIHDNIGQKLTLVSLYIQQLAFENKVPQITSKVLEIGEIINESLEELRQLSKSLTSNTIEQHSLSELIATECQRIDALKKCSIHFIKTPDIHIEPYQNKSILFRITQEFLQNSIKHAQCKNIHVSLLTTQNGIELLLKDDGRGFNVDTIKSKGIGLKNIEKRAEMIGGSFTLKSQEGLGTAIIIEIPYK